MNSFSARRHICPVPFAGRQKTETTSEAVFGSSWIFPFLNNWWAKCFPEFGALFYAMCKPDALAVVESSKLKVIHRGSPWHLGLAREMESSSLKKPVSGYW